MPQRHSWRLYFHWCGVSMHVFSEACQMQLGLWTTVQMITHFSSAHHSLRFYALESRLSKASQLLPPKKVSTILSAFRRKKLMSEIYFNPNQINSRWKKYSCISLHTKQLLLSSLSVARDQLLNEMWKKSQVLAICHPSRAPPQKEGREDTWDLLFYGRWTQKAAYYRKHGSAGSQGTGGLVQGTTH